VMSAVWRKRGGSKQQADAAGCCWRAGCSFYLAGLCIYGAECSVLGVGCVRQSLAGVQVVSWTLQASDWCLWRPAVLACGTALLVQILLALLTKSSRAVMV
jgi:hypothetical protein